ncbi:MAG: STAS domain-containing protein [Phycisphaerales bacterium]
MDADDQVITDTQKTDAGAYVALAGDIDLSRSPTLRYGLLQLVQGKPKRLIVDLAGVPYMDSSGVATLVEALQQQRRSGGRMILCGLQPKVRSIFEIARLDMVFTIVEDKDKAMQA